MGTLPRSILIAWAALAYLGVAMMIARAWRRIGYCPVTLFKRPRLLEICGSAGLCLYPLLMVLATYFPELPLSWKLQPLHHRSVHLAGAVLLGAEMVLYAVSVRNLGMSWRIGIDPQAKSPLITSGVYRLIRHPIYASLFLALMGGFLTYACAFSAAVAVLGTPALLLVIRREEEFLLEHFGDEYRAYAARTARLLPKIW